MTAGRYSQFKAKLEPARESGEHCELILVEGDSAASSVCAVRQAQTQSVLPLQGKPLNAMRADAAKVRANTLYAQIAAAMGWPDAVTEPHPEAPLRHGRIVLLFDPDADGIHIGALMMGYFARWQPWLIEEARLLMVRAPMFTIKRASGETFQAWSQAHLDALMGHAHATNEPAPSVHRHLGLASLPPPLLARLCVSPETRQGKQVEAADIDVVNALFGRPQ